MWTLHKQPQHCGAQIPARERGRAPSEATRDREAQDHDRAGDATLQPGDYPASPIAHEGGKVGNEVEKVEQQQSNELPLPDGK